MVIGVFTAGIISASAVIVTSNYDLYYAVKSIADPSHQIYYIVDETVNDPYSFTPLESHIRLLNRADVFIHTGTFEKRWIGEALWLARNPKIVEGAIGHVDISKYIRYLNGSHCFIYSKEDLKKLAIILSGILKKLSPDFSEEFYQKRLSEFFDGVDKFFSELSTVLAPYAWVKMATYSPCISNFVVQMKLNSDLVLKRRENEVFSYRAARDSAEFMKKMNIPLVVTPHNVEKDAEIGFISAGIAILKVPVHLGKKFPDFSSIVKGISFIGEIEKVVPQKEEISQPVSPKPPTYQITTIPPEKPPAEVQKYGYITSRYSNIILRDSPQASAGQAGKISGGQRVLVLDRQNEWVKVTDGRSIGWVRSSVITIEE